MAVFTPVYAIWPVFAWPILGTLFFVTALGWSVYLAGSGMKTLRLSRQLPQEKYAEGERIEKGVSVLSGIEGVLILVSAVTLALLGQWVWILPVAALPVALHFFPMASLFGRTIDYYLGSVMLISSVTGIVLTAQQVEWVLVWGITGAGGALVTSAYGLYIVLTARRTLQRFRLGVTSAATT